MFKSLLNLTTDLVKIASAPVEIASDVVQTVTKPIAEVAETVVKEVKETTKSN